MNLPESAQEPQTRDIPKKGLQQRRQLLQSILAELQELEKHKRATCSREKIAKIPPVLASCRTTDVSGAESAVRWVTWTGLPASFQKRSQIGYKVANIVVAQERFRVHRRAGVPPFDREETIFIGLRFQGGRVPEIGGRCRECVKPFDQVGRHRRSSIQMSFDAMADRASTKFMIELPSAFGITPQRGVGFG